MSLVGPLSTANNLTISDVATLMRCSTKTVRRMIADGRLPAFRFGGQWRVRRLELERILTKVPTASGTAEPIESMHVMLEYREDIAK